MNTASVKIFKPEQNQTLIKDKTITNSQDFEKLMKQSIISQQSSSTDHSGDDSKLLINENGMMNHNLKEQLERIYESLSSAKDHQSIEQLLSDQPELLELIMDFFNQDFDEVELTDLLKSIVQDEKMISIDSEDEFIHVLTELNLTMKPTSEHVLKVEDMINHHVMELDDVSESQVIQLLTQLQSVLTLMHHGEQPEKVARILLPLLSDWSKMSNQHSSKEALHEIATNILDTEDLEVLNHLQDLYDKRQHFQSRQIYGDSATITRADVAQWIKVALHQSQNDTQNHRVIPTLNNETIQAPKMSILSQQAFHSYSQLESIQRIESEMTTRIASMIQQHMSMQQRGAMQSLNIVLTPDHLGTLQVNFSQVNGELLVRMIVSSGHAKEMLESNLHQLKHAFSPHQVQIVRDDDVLVEEDLKEFQEEQDHEHQEHDEKQSGEQLEQQEEQIIMDFTTLFTEALEEEALLDD